MGTKAGWWISCPKHIKVLFVALGIPYPLPPSCCLFQWKYWELQPPVWECACACACVCVFKIVEDSIELNTFVPPSVMLEQEQCSGHSSETEMCHLFTVTAICVYWRMFILTYSGSLHWLTLIWAPCVLYNHLAGRTSRQNKLHTVCMGWT